MFTAGRRGLLVVMMLSTIAAGSPGLWAAAQEGGDQDYSAAATIDGQEGRTGTTVHYDTTSSPGVRCYNDLWFTPGSVDLWVAAPDVFPYFASGQWTDLVVTLYQVQPGSSQVQPVTSVDYTARYATGTSPAVYPNYSFQGLPLGPTYVIFVDVYWYVASGTVLDGHLGYRIDYYRPYVNVGNGDVAGTRTNACYSPVPPVGALTPTSGIPNSTVSFGIGWFPLNVPVSIGWDSKDLGTVVTDEFGEAYGTFKVPTTTKGIHTVRWTAGNWTASATFEVTSRIKAVPSTAGRGQTVQFQLRGFAARETVRIRWKRGSTWVELTRVTTSSTGSANVNIVVPSWAPDGMASVRGDGTVGRAQTNGLRIAGGSTFQPAEGSPTATPTQTPTPTATVSPTPTQPASPVAETPTVEPTLEATPTEPPGVQETPTPEPTEPTEPVPTESTEPTEPTPTIVIEPTVPDDGSGAGDSPNNQG